MSIFWFSSLRLQALIAYSDCQTMEVIRETPKLDFRFASIEDTENIVSLVSTFGKH